MGDFDSYFKFFKFTGNCWDFAGGDRQAKYKNPHEKTTSSIASRLVDRHPSLLADRPADRQQTSRSVDLDRQQASRSTDRQSKSSDR